MKIKSKRKKRGFTIVETLVYIALISVVLGSFVSFGVYMADLRVKAAAIQTVEESAMISLNLISSHIKRSDSIVIPAPGDEATSTLYLDMPDGNSDIIYSLENGILYITEGAASAVQLTGDGIEILDLSFNNIAKLNQQDSIYINMDMHRRNAINKAYEYSNSYQINLTKRIR